MEKLQPEDLAELVLYVVGSPRRPGLRLKCPARCRMHDVLSSHAVEDSDSAPMKPRVLLAGTGLVAARAVLVVLLGACASPEAERNEGLPAYCSTPDGGDDPDFWRLIEESCRVATDGDTEQARALRDVLADLDAEQVADFHRTFVRVNHSLYTERVAAEAEEACPPDSGLGDDLFTDFRSWVMAHGQAAYEQVLESPETLADFPDIASGCGLGEPFGFAALGVYADKSGRRAAMSHLPILEPTTAPDP